MPVTRRPTQLLLALVILVSAVSPVLARRLTLEERVAAQRAIELVYWRHRIWPEANPGPRPSFQQVMPEAAVRAKVEDSFRKSTALER